MKPAAAPTLRPAAPPYPPPAKARVSSEGASAPARQVLQLGEAKAYNNCGNPVRVPVEQVAQACAVLAFDFHGVLDRDIRQSTNWRDDCPEYPDRNIRFLQRLSQITESRQILVVVLSYCHHSDTVAHVLGTSCNSTDRLICEAGVSVLSLLFVTRKPTGESGKRALLEKVFDIARCPIAIVDDSAEVVGECAGASLAKRGKRVYPRSTVPSFSGLIEAEESLCNWCINSVPNSEE